MALIFDIETVGWSQNEEHLDAVLEELRSKQAKLPKAVAEAKEKARDKMALYPISGRVAIIGMLDTEASAPEMFKFLVSGYENLMDPTVVSYLGEDNEGVMISEFFETITKSANQGSRLVSFAGKRFDLPFLFIRALTYGIKACGNYQELIHPYNNNLHLDISSFLEKGSLNMLSYLVGAGDLTDEKGSEVPKMIEAGNYSEAIDKCKKDLVKTAAIYERIDQWIPMRVQYMTQVESKNEMNLD